MNKSQQLLCVKFWRYIPIYMLKISFCLAFLCVCSLFNVCFYARIHKNSTNSLKFFRCSSNYLSTQTFSLFPKFSCPLSALSCQVKKQNKKQTETKTHTLTFTPPIILFTGSVLSCSFLKYFGVMRCPSLYAVIFFKTIIIWKNNQIFQTRKLFLKLKTV